MAYKYNTETGDLIEDNGHLGASFYEDPWRDATQSEIDDHEIAEAEAAKISECDTAYYEFLHQDISHGGNTFAAQPLDYIHYQLEIAQGTTNISLMTTGHSLASVVASDFHDDLTARFTSAKQQYMVYMDTISSAATVDAINNINISFS